MHNFKLKTSSELVNTSSNRVKEVTYEPVVTVGIQASGLQGQKPAYVFVNGIHKRIQSGPREK